MVRRLKGEKFHPHCLAPSFKSGRESVMVWGCFQGNKLGPLALCPEGRMDAKKYCSILEEHFLPFWNSLGEDSIFMEDGAPPHKAKYTKNWQQDHQITTMAWPAQSPDLNPIENVWQQLKIALEKRTPRVNTKADLLIALQEKWAKLGEKNTLATLIASMPRHVRLVIASNGLPTKY